MRNYAGFKTRVALRTILYVDMYDLDAITLQKQKCSNYTFEERSLDYPVRRYSCSIAQHNHSYSFEKRRFYTFDVSSVCTKFYVTAYAIVRNDSHCFKSCIVTYKKAHNPRGSVVVDEMTRL